MSLVPCRLYLLYIWTDVSPWRWRQQAPPKRMYPTTSLCGVRTQKTTIWIIIVMKTWSLILLCFGFRLFWSYHSTWQALIIAGYMVQMDRQVWRVITCLGDVCTLHAANRADAHLLDVCEYLQECGIVMENEHVLPCLGTLSYMLRSLIEVKRGALSGKINPSGKCI
jgi:hypothetical protein